MCRIRSFAVAEVLLALGLAQISRAQGEQAQAAPPKIQARYNAADATLTIGATTLRLRMAKDAVLHALAMQYEMYPVVPGRRYLVMLITSPGKWDAVGFVDFDPHGTLLSPA